MRILSFLTNQFCWSLIVANVSYSPTVSARDYLTYNPFDYSMQPSVTMTASSFPKLSITPLPGVGDEANLPPSKTFRTTLLISGLTAATALYGATAWWNKSSSEFRVRHEGWFEQDSPNGGADKLGHGYSTYVATRLMTEGFQWAGHNQRQAAQLAGFTSGVLSLGVEIMDGFTEKYGFSTEDAIINLSGIGLGVLLESYPEWDEKFDLRLRYWTSDDAQRLDDYDPVADYSGQTYLWVTKASGFASLRASPWTRYLEVAMGYGTRGYQPTDGTETQSKYRNFYYGVSLNLSQLLNDWVFKNDPAYHTSQTVTTTTLEYLQLPGTALLFEHHLGN